jgi:hypothetical protein
MTKSFNEIISGISDFLSGNGLKNRKKFFEGDSVVGLLTLHQFTDLGFRRV